MQRSAPPAVQPAGAPQNFRQRLRRIGAAGDDVAVIAMRGGEPVARLERGDDRGARRLLADIDVKVPGELSLARERKHRLFEAAHAQHGAQQLPAAPRGYVLRHLSSRFANAVTFVWGLPNGSGKRRLSCQHTK